MTPLTTLEQVRAAEALFARVWDAEPAAAPVTAEVLRAVEHGGGYVVGAYDREALLGASCGFLGVGPGGDVRLHSHITGVLATAQGRGVGRAMKLHQRAWALSRGIATITWTFDPLVRRNAVFNLRSLGAVGVEYLVDFYGDMPDGINQGQASDRLLCAWELRPALPRTPLTDGPVVVPLPDDVEQLRREDPDQARRWRLETRELLVAALSDGLLARGVTDHGSLVLAPA